MNNIIEKIKSVVYKATNGTSMGADINDLIVKNAQDMPIEAIKRIIEQTNVENFMKIAKNGDDRSIQFPLADPNIIFSKIGNNIENKMSDTTDSITNLLINKNDSFYTKESSDNCTNEEYGTGDKTTSDYSDEIYGMNMDMPYKKTIINAQIDEDELEEIDDANRAIKSGMINEKYIGTRGTDKIIRKTKALKSRLLDTVKEAQMHFVDELHNETNNLMKSIRNNEDNANLVFKNLYAKNTRRSIPLIKQLSKIANVQYNVNKLIESKPSATYLNNGIYKIANRVFDLSIQINDLNNKVIAFEKQNNIDLKKKDDSIEQRNQLNKDASGKNKRNSQKEKTEEQKKYDKIQKEKRIKQEKWNKQNPNTFSAGFYKKFDPIGYDIQKDKEEAASAFETLTSNQKKEKLLKQKDYILELQKELEKLKNKEKEEYPFQKYLNKGISTKGLDRLYQTGKEIGDFYFGETSKEDRIKLLKEREAKERERKDTFVDNLILRLKQKDILTDLINNDPILRESDSKGIYNLYNSISKVSDDIPMNKEVIRSWLRASQGQDTIDPNSLKIISEIQKNIIKKRSKYEEDKLFKYF